MEYSWPAECVIKLIQWKYGSLIPLQELQRIQRIEYDPGGSLGRFCRALSQYSNAVVFFALSFAMVNASGHYVNQGVMAAAAAATINGSDLYPPLAAGKTATTSTLADLSLDLPLRRVLPAVTPRGSVLSLYDELVTAASSVGPSSTAFAPTSGAADAFGTDAPDAHISGGPLTNDSVASTNDSGGAEFGVDSIASTVAGVFLSINDSQVPRFGNRTPHSNATEIEGVGYFGILSVVLGLMILLTIVGK